MTDLEINRALALAIGWNREQIIEYDGQDYIGIGLTRVGRPTIKLFSYTFWTVIGPIAERYDCFPYLWGGKWEVPFAGGYSRADTPQKAIALAVIEGAEK